jgi:hypothetical protein
VTIKGTRTFYSQYIDFLAHYVGWALRRLLYYIISGLHVVSFSAVLGLHCCYTAYFGSGCGIRLYNARCFSFVFVGLGVAYLLGVRVPLKVCCITLYLLLCY